MGGAQPPKCWTSQLWQTVVVLSVLASSRPLALALASRLVFCRTSSSPSCFPHLLLLLLVFPTFFFSFLFSPPSSSPSCFPHLLLLLLVFPTFFFAFLFSPPSSSPSCFPHLLLLLVLFPLLLLLLLFFFFFLCYCLHSFFFLSFGFFFVPSYNSVRHCITEVFYACGLSQCDIC